MGLRIRRKPKTLFQAGKTVWRAPSDATDGPEWLQAGFPRSPSHPGACTGPCITVILAT